MRMAITEAILALIEARGAICCPSCYSKGPFVHGIKKETEEEIAKQVGFGSDNVVHSYDSFRCLACHQRWTSAYRLVFSPTVEYTSDVGDKINETRPLTELL